MRGSQICFLLLFYFQSFVKLYEQFCDVAVALLQLFGFQHHVFSTVQIIDVKERFSYKTIQNSRL